MYISGLDCTKGKQPPVYCRASEEGLEGEIVAGYPSDVCGTGKTYIYIKDDCACSFIQFLKYNILELLTMICNSERLFNT